MPVLWIFGLILAVIWLMLWWIVKSGLWPVFLTAVAIYAIIRWYIIFRSRP